MKRSLHLAFALIFALGTIPLLGAVTILAPPVVVVFPLTVGSGGEPEAGSNIAVLLAQRLAQAGGVDVKPYPPGTQRPEFLTTARSMNADYYVTGFLTPLGEQVSLITQVVSVASGTIIASNTALVKTYNEAAGQADTLREEILHHAGRALASIGSAPRETPAPTKPPEKTSGNVSGLFKRKKKTASTPAPSPSEGGERVVQATAKPAPRTTSASRATSAPRAATSVPRPPTARTTPTPRPVAVRTPRPTTPPTRLTASATGAPLVAALRTPRPSGAPIARLALAASVLVVSVAGDDDPALDAYAQDAMVSTLQHSGTAAGALPIGVDELPARAREACAAAFGARTIYAPTLSLDRDRDGNPNTVELDVVAYDCGGAVAGRQHARARIGRSGATAATNAAVADIIGAFAFANQAR